MVYQSLMGKNEAVVGDFLITIHAGVSHSNLEIFLHHFMVLKFLIKWLFNTTFFFFFLKLIMVLDMQKGEKNWVLCLIIKIDMEGIIGWLIL